jgi:hypothetical protein
MLCSDRTASQLMLYNLNVVFAISDVCASDEYKSVSEDLFLVFKANRNEQMLIQKTLQRELNTTCMAGGGGGGGVGAPVSSRTVDALLLM